MDLDITLIIQLGIFCTVLVILNTVVLKPFLQVIEARHAKIHGARAEAERLSRLSADDQDSYEARIKEARRSAQREREELRGQGRDKERRLLADVRADIAKHMNETREQVGVAEARARTALSQDTAALAQQLVEKVLGRKVSAS